MFVIGLFRELGTGIACHAPSIKGSINGLSKEEADIVCEYMKSIEPLVDVLWCPIDPIDEVTHVGSAPSICSDGMWVWRLDLIYYVEKYCITVPVDFVARAREHKVVRAKWSDIMLKIDDIEKTYSYAVAEPSTRADLATSVNIRHMGF